MNDELKVFEETGNLGVESFDTVSAIEDEMSYI